MRELNMSSQQETVVSKMKAWSVTHLFQIFWSGVVVLGINGIYFAIALQGNALATIFATNFPWLAMVDAVALGTMSFYGIILALNSKGLTMETTPLGQTPAPVQTTLTAAQISQIVSALKGGTATA